MIWEQEFWKKPENWSVCSQAVCTTTFVIKVGSQSKQKLTLQSDLSTTDFSKLNITELHPNRRIDLYKEFYIMSMYSIYMYICIYTYIYCIKPSALSNRYIEHPSFVGALFRTSSLHSCPPSNLRGSAPLTVPLRLLTVLSTHSLCLHSLGIFHQLLQHGHHLGISHALLNGVSAFGGGIHRGWVSELCTDDAGKIPFKSLFLQPKPTRLKPSTTYDLTHHDHLPWPFHEPR